MTAFAFPQYLTDLAAEVLEHADGMRIVTAESCTGGLLAACFTAIPGSSKTFSHGFVTYSNDAKTALLGVPPALIADVGAVSKEVAEAMVRGCLDKALPGDWIAASITGVAGPGGGSDSKPVGLVHIAAALRRDGVLSRTHRECRFGDAGRDAVREKSAEAALRLMLDAKI